MIEPVILSPANAYRPLHIVEATGQLVTNRLGGLPPAGVAPAIVGAQTRYFATLALERGLSVSVFLGSSDLPFADELTSRHEHLYRLWTQDTSPLIQFVVHEDREAGDPSPLRSPYQACALQFGELALEPLLDLNTSDALESGADELWEDHKIGGYPYFEHWEGTALEDSATALSNGYAHLLQLTGLGRSDAMLQADWPFYTWTLHLFGKKDREDWTFSYAIG